MSPRRTSFFISVLIDLHRADPGKQFDFECMKDSTVIFITRGDVVGDELSVYDFRREDVKTTHRLMGDGNRILYVNARARHEGRMAELMDDFIRQDPDAVMVPEFASRARRIKDSGRYPEMESLFDQARRVGFEHGVEAGLGQGMQRGVRAEKTEPARRLLAMGLPARQVAFAIGVEEDDLETYVPDMT